LPDSQTETQPQIPNGPSEIDRVNFTKTIHRLVAAEFLGTCPKGIQVNHKDGDRLNNHASNLEYVTPSENTRHSVVAGLLTRNPFVLAALGTSTPMKHRKTPKEFDFFSPRLAAVTQRMLG
jgi:hypothetical protein